MYTLQYECIKKNAQHIVIKQNNMQAYLKHSEEEHVRVDVNEYAHWESIPRQQRGGCRKKNTKSQIR